MKRVDLYIEYEGGAAMRFMLLIYGDETQWDYSPQAMAPWAKFNEEVAERNQVSRRATGDREGGDGTYPRG